MFTTSTRPNELTQSRGEMGSILYRSHQAQEKSGETSTVGYASEYRHRGNVGNCQASCREQATF